MAKVLIEETTLTAIGDAIREKENTTELVPVNDMATRISAIQGGGAELPDEAYNVTGNCTYKFSYSGWNWFLDMVGSKLTTSDISNAYYMFYSNPRESIPFDVNLTTSCDTTNMFASCNKLKTLPKITNLRMNNSLFNSCGSLTNLNGNKFIALPTSGVPCQALFGYCNRLRSVADIFDDFPNTASGNSIYGMYNWFINNSVLDEATNLPYIYGTYNASYSFGSFVNNCYRLKELTFRPGIALTSGPKGNTLSLTTYVGYGHSTLDLTTYGIPAGKLVTDDASYQALKNDPDWWTKDVAYSRYNHDSAVNTINSLPDLSAITSYKNTISFNGASGSATDGGAINTLTAEEIAVATAKGWTVTLA